MSEIAVAEPSEGQIVKPRRIDGPHAAGILQEERSPALVAEMAGVGAGSPETYPTEPFDFSRESAAALDDLLELDNSLDAREEQLENQAGQLGRQLQEQLRELEYREALQNARSAELDNEFRSARLWIAEKSAELTDRENGIVSAAAKLAAEREEAERQRALREQSASREENIEVQQFVARHHELEARQAVLLRREQELVQRQQLADERGAALSERERQFEAKEFQLRERRQFIEREAAALHHARQEWERSCEEERTDLAKERAGMSQALDMELSQRAEALSTGESMLAEHVRELEQDRQSLARERADWQRQKSAELEGVNLLRHRTEAELEQRRTRLATREKVLDQQQGALDQLRGEITAAHRQSIEMRLIAEQLWAQVQGRMPPVEITQSIAELRLKLGEQYRVEQQGLVEQKQELLQLAEKVAEQSRAHRDQRQELQSWFAAREEEIERHAKSLVTREQELLQQSDQLRAIESRWSSDRRHLEQELRELRSRLRQAA
jgi:hypothetical protein